MHGANANSRPKSPSSAAVRPVWSAPLRLQAAGVDTLLIAPLATPDHRTTALLSGSVTALETLGVWQAACRMPRRLKKLRIIDDTRRLFRAPEVFFDAAEIGLDAFGYNIENRHLFAALEARAAALKLPRITAPALAIRARCGRRHDRAMPTAKRACGSRSAPTERARSAAPRPGSARNGGPIRRPR